MKLDKEQDVTVKLSGYKVYLKRHGNTTKEVRKSENRWTGRPFCVVNRKSSAET